MTEVSKDIMERRAEQLEGLRNLFVKVFDEYYAKHGELPNLMSDKDVDNFVIGRPEIQRTIHKQDLVLREVARVALEVLGEKKKNLESKDKQAV
jgi:hypothetical protein